jgi:2-desacetyl-2-hydroxyethyl bacteriochlorophyllide A dehydrogenase
MKRTSVIFKSPSEIELGRSDIPSPGRGEVLVKTLMSAISPGSEMLVYRGQFPSNLPVDANIPALGSKFGYPLKYGYASVGRIIEVGPSVSENFLNRTVFCFHPHESHYVVGQDQSIPVPADIDPSEALFLPNMETSVNFVMDGRPVIGETVVVFGQGIVGLLTTALLAMFPLNSLVTLDRFPDRRRRSLEAGARISLDPDSLQQPEDIAAAIDCGPADNGVDLVYEISGNPDALNQAIAIAGFGARIIIGSWYGSKNADLNMGAEFHRNRIHLVGSQVSSFSPEFSGRWSKDRRMDTAWNMIRRIRPAGFITHRFDVRRAKEAYELLDKKPQEAVQIILTYDQ